MKPVWLIGALALMISGCGLASAPTFSASSSGSLIGRLASGAALAQAPGPPAPKKGHGKHWFWHLLDILILSSPLTGIVAVAMFLDPEVMHRPPGLLRYKELHGEGLRLWPGVRRRILTKMGILIVTGSCCFFGVLTLIFHLIGFV